MQDGPLQTSDAEYGVRLQNQTDDALSGFGAASHTRLTNTSMSYHSASE